MALRTLWSPSLAALSLLLLDGMPHAGSLLAAPEAIHKIGPAGVQATLQLAAQPLRFEANAGQWADDVRFVARHGSTQLVLRDDGAMLTRGSTSIRLRAAGSRTVQPVGSALLPTKSNFFLGDDPSKYRTDVANYGTVTYPNVRDGVDLVYRGEGGQIEYDFLVGKGVDVASVVMNVEGAEALSLTPEGDLLVHTADGTSLQSRPRVYQRGADGKEVDVKSSYRIVDHASVGFEVAAYDRTRELVIDPKLAYSAFLAGSGVDNANAVAVDADGAAYIAGQTAGTNFPATAGSAQATLSAGTDAYVSKISAAGVNVYTTYLGGSGTDIARGIAIDANKNAYVLGYVSNTGTFATTAPAIKAGPAVNEDAFLVKLNAAGNTRVYSTLIGGTGNDRGNALVLDSADPPNAYITGQTTSPNYFATPNAIGDAQLGTDAFVSKINGAGSAFVYSSYLGHSGTDIGWGIALDSQQRPIVVGQTNSANFPSPSSFKTCETTGDAFLTRFNADVTLVERSGCYGGSADDIIRGVAIDALDRLYIVGDTLSANLDVTTALPAGVAGSRHMFAGRVALETNDVSWQTYLAGNGTDTATGIAVDASNRAYVTGYTTSSDYPAKNSLMARSTSNDVVVTKLGTSGNILYSTYLGLGNDDRGNAIAVGPNDTAYVVGQSGTGNVGIHALPLTATPATVTFGTRNSTDSIFFRLTTPGPVTTATPDANDVAAGTTVPPRGTTTLTYAGNGPFTPVLLTNASGGTFVPGTGVYTAGSTGDVTDVIAVTDAEFGTSTFEIAVTAGVSIRPANPATPPGGTLNFAATGGKGAPYTWSLTANPSGGTVVASTGAYTAGAVSGTDVIRAVDDLGNEKTLQIAVGAGIAITPAAPAPPPRGALEFVAAGGSGTGYVWSLTANPSGGTIEADGSYVAGAVGNTTDVVRVVDSLANERLINVAVGPGVAIQPPTSTVAVGTAFSFTATGGNGVYTWSGFALPSGGNIMADTGLYSAGVTANTVTDIIQATDTLGNTATATVQVIGTNDVEPDAGTSSSSGGSSSGESSSSGGSSSSGNASSSGGSSSSGAPSTSSSSGGPTGGSTSSSSGDGETPSGDDDGGGCSAAPDQGASNGLGGLAFGLGVVAMLRRRKRAA